jgi:hypothetical protein
MIRKGRLVDVDLLPDLHAVLARADEAGFFDAAFRAWDEGVDANRGDPIDHMDACYVDVIVKLAATLFPEERRENAERVARRLVHVGWFPGKPDRPEES